MHTYIRTYILTYTFTHTLTYITQHTSHTTQNPWPCWLKSTLQCSYCTAPMAEEQPQAELVRALPASFREEDLILIRSTSMSARPAQRKYRFPVAQCVCGLKVEPKWGNIDVGNTMMSYGYRVQQRLSEL